MSVTGEQILAAVLQYGGGNGLTVGLGRTLFNANITLSTTALTSVFYFRDGLVGTDNWLGSGLYWPANSAALPADYFRHITTVVPSTGVVSFDGNFSAATLGSTNLYQLRRDLTPQGFLNALTVAMRETYFTNMEPLSSKPAGTLVADAGFQSTVTTSFVESDALGGPAITFSKVTTANADTIATGIGAGRGVNAAPAGYLSQRFNVTPQEQIIWHTLSSAAIGTAEAVLWDITNAAAIGTTVEHSLKAYQWMKRTEQVPAGCEVLETRLQGEGATDDINWNATCLNFPERSRITLDTTWDTSWKMPQLVWYDLRGTQTASYVWPWLASAPRPIPPEDYDFLIERPGANPYAVQFHNDAQRFYMDYPIYIQGRRAYSDLTTFTLALTGTTAADLELIAAKTMREWLLEEGRTLSDARDLLRIADRKLASAEARAGSTTPTEVKESYSIGGIWN